MPSVALPPERSHANNPLVGIRKQLPVNLTRDTWHAAWSSGSAVNATSGFTDPSIAYADRVPELALAVGGTPGAYVLTGTFDGETKTESVTTVANATVKATGPFDTITSVVGPDPAATLTLYHGDTYCTPPSRGIWTGAGGAMSCQLADETAVQAGPSLPMSVDRVQATKRISRDSCPADVWVWW